jgi:hypothetical protein
MNARRRFRRDLRDSLDEQQLYGGTQSVLSTTLLLWTSSAGADGAPIVEKQHRCGEFPVVVPDGSHWRLGADAAVD